MTHSQPRHRSLHLSLLDAIFIRNLAIPFPLLSSQHPNLLPSARNYLLDSYLSLSLPNFDPIILNSDFQLASNNPSFTIDLDSALDSCRLHPSVLAIKHLIRRSCFLLITLHIRNSYPPIIPPSRTRPRARNRFESLQNSHDDDHHADLLPHESFRPAFQWSVDLHQLVYLGKADSDTILFPPPKTSPDATNQLYLKLGDEIYLFRPTPPCTSTSISDLDGTLSLPPAGPELEESAILPAKHTITDQSFEDEKIQDGKMFRISDAIKLHEKEKEITKLMSEISSLEKSLNQTSNNHLARNQSGFHLSRRLLEIDHHINHLNSQQTRMGNRLDELKEELQQRADAIATRRTTVQSARLTLTELVRTRIMAARRTLTEVLVPQQRGCRTQLERRRAELVRGLDTVFPIAPVTGADAPLLFSIAGVPLRPLETGADQDERTVASALGLVAQLTMLVAMYLAVPVLYPISCIGSRSVVSDYVSRIKGPRSFPLYFKGVDRYRFEYAVFLLNKDIEQIMYHRQVTVSDLRHTLPNLKNLLLTVETSGEGVESLVCCSTRDTQPVDSSVQQRTDCTVSLIDSSISTRSSKLKEDASGAKERQVAPEISITRCGSEERGEE